ncbi:MAG: hypothetical protein LBB62_05960, partial [Proteiniphilum sp.]|nr:hypothetical protein [Proteiniphilum sp.]
MKKVIFYITFIAISLVNVWAQKPDSFKEEPANVLYSAGTNKSIPLPAFGQYTVGDDYFLANYQQLIEYWTTLEKLSGRIKVVDFGTTPEGRTMKLAIIT